MKFKICHDPEKKTLSIPRAALQLSHLSDAEKLDLLAGDGFVLTARDDLSAAECVGMIQTLSDLTVGLIARLAEASREAAKESACGGCGEDCGLSLPPCLLEQAGIGQDEALNASAEGGRIIIQMAEPEGSDPLRGQEDEFLIMLDGCGVDLDGLRMLLTQGGAENG